MVDRARGDRCAAVGERRDRLADERETGHGVGAVSDFGGLRAYLDLLAYVEADVRPVHLARDDATEQERERQVHRRRAGREPVPRLGRPRRRRVVGELDRVADSQVHQGRDQPAVRLLEGVAAPQVRRPGEGAVVGDVERPAVGHEGGIAADLRHRRRRRERDEVLGRLGDRMMAPADPHLADRREAAVERRGAAETGAHGERVRRRHGAGAVRRLRMRPLVRVEVVDRELGSHR